MLTDVVVLEVVLRLEGEQIWKIDFTSEISGGVTSLDKNPNELQ